ncbi:MAG TPA: hypothetical protein VEQ40_08315, partial [Pyrinomonadaceae bacterium]|nr:hypothetical protein [Pyrinomonadaceae bacterium]
MRWAVEEKSSLLYLRPVCSECLEMRSGSSFIDYEPVTPSRRARSRETEEAEASDFLFLPPDSAKEEDSTERPSTDNDTKSKLKKATKPENWIFRRGHAISYAGLFLFTVVLYFRPYELFTALRSLTSLAFWLGVFTLAAFLPSQIATEGNLTARPREVNLLLLFCLAALISIPLAINPGEAWGTFTEFLRPAMIFIVMINVVRTEWRLKGIFFLTLLVSVVLSVGAINDYRMARFSVEGYRVAGIIGNLFGNPNDMALHLATIFPLTVALMFAARRAPFRLIYAACGALMVAGIVVTFSRGGFLALAGALGVICWKIGRKHRMAVMLS